MRLLRTLALSVAASALFAGAALADHKPGHHTPPGHGGTPPGQVKVPEIDAGAGLQALALLAGVLLLVSEGSRRRRL